MYEWLKKSKRMTEEEEVWGQVSGVLVMLIFLAPDGYLLCNYLLNRTVVF